MDIKNYKIDEKIKRAYIESFKGISDEMYYLIIICTKILRCNEETISVDADIDRLYDEFVYFKYYSSMSGDYMLNFFMPLMVASRNFESYEPVAKNLAEKLCRFYGNESAKYDYILDVFCYDIILRNLLADNKEILESLNKIKDGLIGFNPYADSKLDNVKFQMKKIKYIEKIHKCIDSIEFGEKVSKCETGIGVIDILQFIDDKDYTEKICSSGNSGFLSVYNVVKYLTDVSQKDDYKRENEIKIVNESLKSSKYREFIEAMSEHLLKLRYGKVNVKKYSVKASPRQFLDREIGDEFIDPILSKVKLDSRETVQENGENKIVINILAKTGEYKFEYRIKE